MNTHENEYLTDGWMITRPEKPQDIPSIYAVNLSAFDTPSEADLVDRLRQSASPVISLVAEENDQIVGHIMFSPLTLPGFDELKIMGLGPMAVKPSHQKKGIGSMLVRQGLATCREAGFGAVAVLGHTWFYPRFGFNSSVQHGIRSEYNVPENVFMLVELIPGYLNGASGTIKYHPAFNNV